MPHLIEVAFKGNRKEFFLWEQDEPPPYQAAVIVDADRGEDFGRVHAQGELAARRAAGCTHGLAGAEPTRKVLRLASAEEIGRASELREQDESARRRGMERVRANHLVMKLSDAEWQWDRKKLTFYFTAEKRVDFRTLVRDLAAMFRTRIELKQIGVRDEAKRLDGVGRCGRQYCSASWLPELRPVNLGVAKDQKLSLNPTQISGACGRLMCCLRYEHEFYVHSRKRFPKEGRIITTARGEEKVIANDIFNERVTLRNVEGESRVLPLTELRREMGQESGESPAIGDAGDADESGPLDLPPELALDEEDAGRGMRGPVAAGRSAPGPRVRPTPPRRPPPGGERVSLARAPRPTAAPPAAEPVSAPAAAVDVPAPPPVPAEPPASAAADDAERRTRRRRGRRGGRRGRSNAGGGGSANGIAGPDAGTDDEDKDTTATDPGSSGEQPGRGDGA